jgi:hypothetical protein
VRSSISASKCLSPCFFRFGASNYQSFVILPTLAYTAVPFNIVPLSLPLLENLIPCSSLRGCYFFQICCCSHTPSTPYVVLDRICISMDRLLTLFFLGLCCTYSSASLWTLTDNYNASNWDRGMWVETASLLTTPIRYMLTNTIHPANDKQ